MVINQNPLLIRRRQIPTRNTVQSKYVRKSGAVVSGGGRRRKTRRSRGGSRFAIPSVWSPGIVDNATDWLRLTKTGRRRGEAVGYGIGNLLSKGLEQVARKGGEVVKKEAKKHGARIASSLTKEGHKLVGQVKKKAKRRTQAAISSGISSLKRVGQKKIEKKAAAISKLITGQKKSPSIKRLVKSVKSISKSTKNTKRRTPQKKSRRRRRRRRHRRSRTGIQRKAYTGILPTSYTGIL